MSLLQREKARARHKHEQAGTGQKCLEWLAPASCNAPLPPLDPEPAPKGHPGKGKGPKSRGEREPVPACHNGHWQAYRLGEGWGTGRHAGWVGVLHCLGNGVKSLCFVWPRQAGNVSKPTVSPQPNPMLPGEKVRTGRSQRQRCRQGMPNAMEWQGKGRKNACR